MIKIINHNNSFIFNHITIANPNTVTLSVNSTTKPKYVFLKILFIYEREMREMRGRLRMLTLEDELCQFKRLTNEPYSR